MAGGFGTRLRPLTNNLPKPMVPIVNKPMMEHLVSLLKMHNITDYIMLLYYLPDVIKDYFGDGSKFGVNIEYVFPQRDFGTAGAVKCAEKYINDDFLVISGDVLTDFNLSEFYNFHSSKESIATISLYSSDNPLQYGIVLMDSDNKIVQFLEKPSSSEVFSDTINTGIYFLKKDIFEFIPEGENFDFSKDLFPLLLEKGISLYGYKNSGYWRDIGNLEDYLHSNLDVLNNALHYIRARDYYGNCVSHSAKIETGVTIENSVIGDNVYLGKNVSVKNSVIWDNVKIADNTTVLFDVIGRNTEIGSNSRINDYVFIGDDCKIGKNVFISSSLKIWNKKVINNNAKITRSLIYEETFFNELFTDSRITGLSNLQINPEFAAKLGSAYGAFVGQNNYVMVGRDIDDISNMIKRSITSGILSAGVNVLDLQVIPIPMLRQELKNGRGAGGVFVRKSPFDADLTDIIFFDSDGKDLSSGKTKSIERLYFSEEYQRAPYNNVGTLKYPERTNEKYKEHFLSCLDVNIIRKRKFKLVIDYSFGITSTIFPTILGEFNCETVSLSAHLDKRRITRDEAEFRAQLNNLCFVVKSLNFDYGFMIDAGGEKIWLATNSGNIVNDDRFLSIVVKLFLLVTPDVKKIAVPVQASTEIDLIAKEHNVEVVRVKNTHYSMMRAFDDKEVKFAGGTKRGFLFPDFLYATDGMFSVAKIMEMIAKSGLNISDIDAMIPRFYIRKVNLPCVKEEKGRVMRKFMEDTIEFKQMLIDGVKVFINDTDTVLCIPDKTRDIIHLNVEADTPEKADALLEKYKLELEKYIRN